jgi:hypothetical protein
MEDCLARSGTVVYSEVESVRMIAGHQEVTRQIQQSQHCRALVVSQEEPGSYVTSRHNQRMAGTDRVGVGICKREFFAGENALLVWRAEWTVSR